MRDALTLKPLSTLQSAEATTIFRGGLAYSPDGHSLAGCSDSAIIIWDTQTGGEVTRVKCEITSDGLGLTWSKDGGVIATVSPWKSETITIHTYNIASGVMLSLGTLRSKDKPHIWAYGKSFQVLVTGQDEKGRTFNIFEVGLTLTRVESFSLQFDFPLGAFSPTAFWASMSRGHGGYHGTRELLILDIRNSEVLLQEKQDCIYDTFSPDASFFAAFSFTRNQLSIWKYSSGHYIRWREFQQTWTLLQFSPTSLSIIGTSSSSLYILHLDYFPAVLAAGPTETSHHQLKDAFSPGNTYIATAYQGESTVTITSLQSQNPFPSQSIDTELEISTLVLTGNVLLVKSPDKIVAWLLTEEGVVDEIIGNTRADRSDSLWELSIPTLASRLAGLLRKGSIDDKSLAFSVVDDIAIIRLHGFQIHAYHIGTGEVIKGHKITQPPDCASYRFINEQHLDECNLYHNSLHLQQGTTNSEWLLSQTALQEGWVKDPEGKHRLWLPPSWRQIKGDINWLHGATSLRFRDDHKLVIIKF